MSWAAVSWGSPQWTLPASIAVLLLVGLLIWSYATAKPRTAIRWLAFACKLTAIVLLAFCLLEPLSTRTRAVPGANLFAILVDDSQSMQIDRQDIPGAETLTTWLDSQQTSWVARLAQEFDLRRYRFGNRLESIDSDSPSTFTATASHLHGALTALADRYQ